MSTSHSSNPEPDPQLRRRRTVEMYDGMEERNWVEDTRIINGEPYLIIDDTPYRILDSGVTEFDNRDKPLVSVGARLSRELIILDPSSKYLQSIYSKLKFGVENLNEEDQDIQTILNFTINFVRNFLRPDSGKLKEKVNELRGDPNNYMKSDDGKPIKYKGNPAILLDTFIRERVGVCRHHALLAAYLIHNLVLDGLLPPGHVFSHRDTVESGGAHVWTIYKPIQPVFRSNEYDFYLVDSLWNTKAYNLRDYAPIFKECGYGEGAIQYCIYRHNRPDIESVAYTKIDRRNPRLKDDFIHDLLCVPVEMRRKFLNQQHSLGACEKIMRDLTSSSKYRSYRNYDALLDDLERVLNENLHKKNYAQIKDSDDRQQFVLRLLCISEDERSRVIYKQTKEDLRQLQNSLNTAGVDRKGLYEQFATYQSVLQEIKGRLEIKLLHEGHYDEIDELDDRQQFMIGLLLCTANERESLLDKQNIADLKHIKLSLEAKDERHDVYRHFDTYRDVLADVEKRIEVKGLHDEHYDQITNSSKKQKFTLELLRCKSEEERRLVLDKQNLADLDHLRKSLIYRKDFYLEQKPSAYQSVLKDIEKRIQLENFLHNAHYHSIGRDSRKQFVTGLLNCMSEDERRSILNKQNISDIKHLQMALMRSDGYEELHAYQSVIREIDRRIIMESLNLIKTIITSGQLEITSGGWTTTFWMPGKKIEISPEEDVRVPTCAQVIYKKIKEVNLESASLKTLMTLLDSIKISAIKSSDKDHKDRTDSTRSLLNVLKDDYARPIGLLEELQNLESELTAPAKPKHRHRSLTPT